MQSSSWMCLLLVAVAFSLCAAQVNFTPTWGKRGMSAPCDGCKTTLESMVVILKLVQAEAQKLAECERAGNM